MKSYKSLRKPKLNKILIIIAIVLLVIAIIGIIVYFVMKNDIEKGDYKDRITAMHHFSALTIDLDTKVVKRDDVETTLLNEFDISESEQTEESLQGYVKFLKDNEMLMSLVIFGIGTFATLIAVLIKRKNKVLEN